MRKNENVLSWQSDRSPDSAKKFRWSVHYFSYTFVFEYLGFIAGVEIPDLIQGKTPPIGY